VLLAVSEACVAMCTPSLKLYFLSFNLNSLLPRKLSINNVQELSARSMRCYTFTNPARLPMAIAELSKSGIAKPKRT
jgi:hypothetical protein